MTTIINFDGLYQTDPISEDIQVRMLSPLGGRPVFPEQGTNIYRMAEGALAPEPSQIESWIRSALSASTLYTLEEVTVSIIGDTMTVTVVIQLPDGVVRTVMMATPTDLRRVLLEFISAFGLTADVQETADAITVTLYETIDPTVDPTFGRRQVTAWTMPKAQDGVVNGFSRVDENGMVDAAGDNLALHRTVGSDIIIPGVFTTAPAGQALTGVTLEDGHDLVFTQSAGAEDVTISLDLGLNSAQVDARVKLQVDDEAALRLAGDDLQIEEVGTRQRYIDVVALQATSNNPLRMVISADIQVPPASGSGPDQALAQGEVLEFAPRTNTPEPYRTVNINWRADQTHVSDTVETETQWNAKTSAHANVHNHLWLRVTKRLFSTISGARRAREVGELYHIPPRSTVAEFIVDTTSKEEADAIVNAAIENSVAFWARSAPGNVVNGQRAYPLPGDLAENPQKDRYLANDGNKNVWRAVSSTAAPADGSIDTAKLKDDAVTGPKIAAGAVAPHQMTSRGQASLLNATIVPVRPAIAGQYTVTFGDPGVLNTGIFVQVVLNGRVVGGRSAWTQQQSLSVTPTADDVTAIARVNANAITVAVEFRAEASGPGLPITTLLLTVDIDQGVKVVKVANEAAYNAISPKDTNTFYYVAVT